MVRSRALTRTETIVFLLAIALGFAAARAQCVTTGTYYTVVLINTSAQAGDIVTAEVPECVGLAVHDGSQHLVISVAISDRYFSAGMRRNQRFRLFLQRGTDRYQLVNSQNTWGYIPSIPYLPILRTRFR